MQAVTITQITPVEFEQLIESSLRKIISSQPNKDHTEQDERLTRKDIKRLYKISYPTIHSLMKQGLTFSKVGRKTLFKRSDVDKFFSQKRG